MAPGPLVLALLVLLAPADPSPPPPPAKEVRSSNGGGGGPDDRSFVAEYFVQGAQKLSFYSWYANARLFRFRVPEDTVQLRWLLQASQGRGPDCGSTNVTVHFRHGAPPVINPLGTQFPANTSVRLAYNLTTTLATLVQNTTFINVTGPAAGDWFMVAHLPKAAGKIEVKGISTPCTYSFQPDMFVLRVIDSLILEPDTPAQQTIAQPARPLHAKIFVPGYSAALHFELGGCKVNTSSPCALRVTLGSATLPSRSQKVLNCSGDCSGVLASPPWEKWLPITVESLSGPGTSVSFQLKASFTVCKPDRASSFLSFYHSLNRSQEAPLPGGSPNATLLTGAGAAHNPLGQSSRCLRNQPVIREDLDVVSLHFRVLGDVGVPVQAEPPALLLFNLNSGMDSGGTLVLNLALNQTDWSLGNASVWACLSASSPVLSVNATRGCHTAFSQGYPLNVSTSSPDATLIIPYPETANWFLSLQLLCPEGVGECDKAKAQVSVVTLLSPCFDNCGTYGQCSLLGRSYPYAGCSCKAGWSGWSCTEDTKAQPVGTQILATLLLTLSNLFFLPAIAVALYHYHLVEASVYAFNMFFSTFYHACDQPGIAVMCIMDYDTLQFCDFFGSVVSIWVTVLCMARLEKTLKYVLCVLGTLFIAMSLQLDRRGVWNMMGPCLVALLIMIAAWVHRGVTRRDCYPPSWKRWAFFLCPGITLAVVAIMVYAFIQTKENYFYTHSIWHILVASSVAFLLPPGDKLQNPWDWSRKLLCRYQICKNDREELYAVT
ncbi:post-GPI attachment to proteins factor 6 [Podarcis muralis]